MLLKLNRFFLTPVAVLCAAMLLGSPAVLAKNKAESQAVKQEEIHKQAQQFLDAVRTVLDEAAATRKDARKLPSEKDYTILTPPWTETREAREVKIQALLESALDIVTDVPIVQMQKQIRARRAAIRVLKEQVASLRERRLSAPKDAMLPGLLTDTVDSLDKEIVDIEKRMAANRKVIEQAKHKIYASLRKADIKITPEQLNLMLDSVLGGDIIKLVAAFEAVKNIDSHLGTLMDQSGEDLKTARRYFAMHATLFAMLVHGQGLVIDKIDGVYLRRLGNIIEEIRSTRAETKRLLKGKNRRDQRNTLKTNLKSQAFAEKVAAYYGNYLTTQREKLLAVRERTLRDLRIADNTYRTVEASFQLRTLIDHARASFEAIKRMETPGFDRLFRNEKLRREFEKLTDQLAPAS